MLSKAAAKKLLLAVSVYLLCILVGLAIILAVQFNLHSDIKKNVERAAQEYGSLEELEEGFRYMNIHIYVYQPDKDNFKEVGGQDSEQSRLYSRLALRCHYKWRNSSRTRYTISCTLRPLTFASVAGAPVGNGSGARLYIVRSIKYLPSIIETFIFVLTLMYAGILICMVIRERSQRRVNEIYSTYIANVSHELKTPIASIQAILETLDEGLVTSESDKSRYYGMMHREADHLQHTVQEIIELSKVQDKRTDTSKSIVTMHEILDELVELYSERCDDLDVKLKVLPELDGQPLLYTSSTCMQQILRIILDNAVKFVDEGGCISLDIDNYASYSVIAISDNGIGISAKDMPHIFDRFYKSMDRRNKSGTGLGLAIAKALAEELGEKITAESRPGHGSTFYVTVHHSKEK